MFSNAIHSLTRAIGIYMDNPCVATTVQLKDRLRNLSMAYQYDQKEAEQRITNNVISKIFVNVDVDEAIAKIEKLNKALNELEKG